MQTTGSNFKTRSGSSTMTDTYNKNVIYDMNVSNTGTAVTRQYKTSAVVASALS